MSADLSDPIFTNEDAAWAHYETIRWPDGAVCPHCGSVGNAARLAGKATRRGVHKCRDCYEQFTATVGSVYEGSHIPMHKWLMATHLMCASKKGISAAQLHRMLGFGSYRTAWFMAHRIREAMRDNCPAALGGPGKVVEADETYYGRQDVGPSALRNPPRHKHANRKLKRPVVALVERGGKARVFHIASADKETVQALVRENVHPESRLHTDESRLYLGSEAHFASHETVRHSAKEYARGDVNTNSAEGFFGVFKKGMSGVYQHCGEKHLHRYVTEFEFRHNTRTKLGFTDKDRATLALKGAEGKRLTYRQPNRPAAR